MQLKVRSYAPPQALLLTGTFGVFCSRQGVIERLRRFLPVLPTKLALLLTSSVRQNERHLSAIERHQPTPLRVFLPVLPTKLARLLTRSANEAGASTDCVSQAERKALLTASVRQNERHY